LPESLGLRVRSVTLRGKNGVVSGSLNMKKKVCRIPVLTDED
jgi:hypothetical protein